LGILGFVAFIVFSFIHTIKAAQGKETQERLELLLASAGILSFVIYGLFEFPLERPEHFFMFILYCSFGIGVFLQNSESKKTMSAQPLVALLLITGLFSTYVINKRLSSAKDAKQAVNAFGKRQPALMLRHGQAAHQTYYSLDDFANPVLFFSGMGKLAQGNTNGAINDFRIALDEHPYHILTNIQMGNAYRTQKKFAEALPFFNQALDIAPFNEQALLNRAETSLLLGDWKTSLADLKGVTPNKNNQRYMNVLKQTLASYMQNPPMKEHASLNKFLKGATNVDAMANKFIAWRTMYTDNRVKNLNTNN
jgi:tetratricopeptide (TPR) repeat protein